MLRDHCFSVSFHTEPPQLPWIRVCFTRQLTVGGDRFAILVGGTTDCICCWRDRHGGGCDIGVEWFVGVGGDMLVGLCDLSVALDTIPDWILGEDTWE